MASKKKRCHCVWSWLLFPLVYLFGSSYFLQDIADWKYNPWWEFPLLITVFLVGMGTLVFSIYKIGSEYE